MAKVEEYPTEWPRVSAEVKSEAGWRCVRCGHPDSPVLCAELGIPRGYLPCDDRCTHKREGKKRVLTVHHLDGVKANLRWWNLAPLCQVCHLAIQGKVVMGRMYLWEHTKWFRPYVAGYYALVVLGEELTRDEVEGRMDELLAAGQPHLYGEAHPG